MTITRGVINRCFIVFCIILLLIFMPLKLNNGNGTPHGGDKNILGGIENEWEDFLPAYITSSDFCPANDKPKNHPAAVFISGVFDRAFDNNYEECSKTMRLGGSGDGGKIICIDNLHKGACTVYSLGSRLDFSFEIDILKELRCEVHTFDCTVGVPDPRKLPPGVVFHNWCVGGKDEKKKISSDMGYHGEIGQYRNLTSIMAALGHSQIDLLKMDIERHEFDVFSVLQASEAPSQILFEVHIHNAYAMFGRPVSQREWQALWAKLRELKYATFSYERNPYCPCCCEFSVRMHGYEMRDPMRHVEAMKVHCGELCKVGAGTFSQGKFFPHREISSMECSAYFDPAMFNDFDLGLPYSTDRIPMDRFGDSALSGAVYVKSENHLGSSAEDESKEPRWIRSTVAIMVEQARLGILRGKYGISTTNDLRKALLNADVAGGRVLVIGFDNPWVEACVLEAGAASIVTLEYAPIRSEHALIQSMKPREYRQMVANGSIGLFDSIVTFSSVEHSGLGRNGDPPNPWRDVLEIARAWCVTKKGGTLVIGAPNGEDVLFFNARRQYGNSRWPYLTTGWKQLHRSETASWRRVFVFVK